MINMNGIMLQGFEWYLEDHGNYYNDMITKLDDLKEIGVTSIWLPPVTKATGTNDVGYGIYDLYDLGEFDQKGSVRTKYGTKDELIALIDEVHKRDMDVYCDVVLNHKAGADEEETFQVIEVDPNNRTKDISDPYDIQAWTKFTFPGRQDKYSDFKWNFNHFNGVDYDSRNDRHGIFRIVGENKGWNYGVSSDFGNYDYLMNANIDHAHPEVVDELIRWVHWFIDTLKIDGIRLDAIKHIDYHFMRRFVDAIAKSYGDDFYVLGEYWDQDTAKKEEYLKETQYRIDLLDAGLHYNFHQASVNPDYDIRQLFQNTFISEHPTKAVTFVDNHDSQPKQALESYVEPWFKPHAYASILLRKDGYPVIFYGDYYGINEPQIEPKKEMIDKLSIIRKKYAYGDEDLYLESEHCFGFVRHGNNENPHQLITLMSTKDDYSLAMFVGKEHQGKVYVDVFGDHDARVEIDSEGFGNFHVRSKGVAVYLEENTPI